MIMMSIPVGDHRVVPAQLGEQLGRVHQVKVGTISVLVYLARERAPLLIVLVGAQVGDHHHNGCPVVYKINNLV